MARPLRFHWMLLKGGEGTRERTETSNRIALSGFVETGLPDLAPRIDFCRRAEAGGIDSVLMAFGWYEPDPLLLAAALGQATERLRFIVASRSGLSAPTYFVQQVNTLSAMIGGRVALNVVAGHTPEEQRSYGDFLAHDERYARTEELLAVCHAFWRREARVGFAGRYYQVEDGRLGTPFLADGRTAPEIYVGGQSAGAVDLVTRHGDCWLCMGEAPRALAPRIAPVLCRGREVGLRLGVIVRPTRDEAVEAARSLVADAEQARREQGFVDQSDSESIKRTFERAAADDDAWVTRCLWSGAVPYYGAPAMSLVGTPDEVAAALLDYQQVGVSQFIFHGWPKLDEMLTFGREVIPRVRAAEARQG